jgi:hypothetical protein
MPGARPRGVSRSGRDLGVQPKAVAFHAAAVSIWQSGMRVRAGPRSVEYRAQPVLGAVPNAWTVRQSSEWL